MQELPSQSSSRPSHKNLLEICDVSFLENGPYSFTAEAGECIGFHGASGIGKTQLLKAIADLIPYNGIIRLDGIDNSSISPPEWRKQVGMVPADSCWWYDRVGDHFSTSYNHRRLYDLVERLGFDSDVLNWEVRRLSTGERQRLACVRALILEPVILLMDEPTSALDPHHTNVLEELINSIQLSQQTAIIWVSHDVNQLERVADRVMIVEKDRLLLHDSLSSSRDEGVTRK